MYCSAEFIATSKIKNYELKIKNEEREEEIPEN